jgi:hypothetical protein
MRLTNRMFFSAFALVIGMAGFASAQSLTTMPTGFLNINVAQQTGSRHFANRATFPVYGESASLSGTQKVGGATMFDLGGGVRVWRRLTLGVSLNTMSTHSDLDVTGTVPNPLFANRPRTVTAHADDLSHSETDAHLQASWFVPLTDHLDISIFAGPSFFHVSQEQLSGVNLAEAGFPYSQVTVTGVTTEKHDDTAVGYNVGFDGTWLFTRRLGVGAFARYTHAKAEFESGDSTSSLNVGGLQVGIGLHVRF